MLSDSGPEAEILLAIGEGVATIRLNRPDRLNALTPAMLADFRAAMRQCEDDPGVAAIVITGEGRGFCSGLDLATFASTVGGTLPEHSQERIPGLFSWMVDISKPVIAAVNGAAVGGGFVLAMMADLRFASSGARFSTLFSRRGLVAEHAISHILPRQIGLPHALDLILSARTIDAAEAHAMGFVNRVVEGDEVLREAREYARMLASQVSPFSMAAAKRQVYADLSRGLEEACQSAYALVRDTLGHPDQAESLAAFTEKRPARFQRWRGGDLSRSAQKMDKRP